MTGMFLVLATTLIVFVLAEIALRCFWHNPYRNEKPDHILALPVHHPRTDRIIDRRLIDPDLPPTRFRTDDRSYIIPAFQYEHPDCTIAFFGGSTTECMAVSEEQRFHARVSSILAESGIRANTLNVARAGCTVHDSLNILLNHMVLDEPDIAVLTHVCNDIGLLQKSPRYKFSMGRSVRWRDQAKWAGQKLSTLTWLTAFIRHRLTTTPPVRKAGYFKEGVAPEEPYRERLRAFVWLCRSFDIHPVLATQPAATFKSELTPQWLDFGFQTRFNQIVRDVGAEEGAVVIDLARFFQQQVPDFNKPYKAFYDGLHLTDFGSEQSAAYIADVLRNQFLAGESEGPDHVKP